MIKLTLDSTKEALYISKNHLVSVVDSKNIKGCTVITTRGTYQVSQSAAQVLEVVA